MIKSPRLSEERAAWRDAQKIQAEQKRGTDEIQIQMAQIDAAREEAEIQADKYTKPPSCVDIIRRIS